MKNPRTGVELIKLGKDSWVFMAEPLRALTDLIYLRKEVSWKADGVGFLTESMRMEEEDIKRFDIKKLDKILGNLRDKRTINYLIGMRKEFWR